MIKLWLQHALMGALASVICTSILLIIVYETVDITFEGLPVKIIDGKNTIKLIRLMDKGVT